MAPTATATARTARALSPATRPRARPTRTSAAFYGLGVASGASLFIERIFDDDANEASPFPSDETLTRDAVRHGADIGSNSWGNDVQGEYDTDAAQFDELVRDADRSTPGDQPYILEFSAGNAGPDSQTMGSPATGKNVIATGACENVPGTLALTYGLYADGADTMADFSSRGPCEDGRIKPDVVAPGTWIASAASSAAPDEASIAWTAIDDYYVYMGGTSMSGPARRRARRRSSCSITRACTRTRCPRRRWSRRR